MYNFIQNLKFIPAYIWVHSILFLTLAFFLTVGFAHLSVPHAHAGVGEKSHSHDASAASEIGEEGQLNKVRRTIKITMGDNFYKPKSIKVKKGETVRFIVSNKGDFVHEFAIGTKVMHQAHEQEMLEMIQSGVLLADRIDHSAMDHSSMTHDDPNSVLLEPNQKGEIIWKFSKEADIEFACNVPGHYEDGMVGKIQF